MARIDGVLNDFVNHVTSGLSGFITAAYDACDRAGISEVGMKLLPELEVPEPLASDAELTASAQSLVAKFTEILGKQLQETLDKVASLSVEIDFLPDADRVRERHQMMSSVPVYYGDNPVYRCTISMRLISGRERTVTVEDL